MYIFYFCHDLCYILCFLFVFTIPFLYAVLDYFTVIYVLEYQSFSLICPTTFNLSTKFFQLHFFSSRIPFWCISFLHYSKNCFIFSSTLMDTLVIVILKTILLIPINCTFICCFVFLVCFLLGFYFYCCDIPSILY